MGTDMICPHCGCMIQIDLRGIKYVGCPSCDRWITWIEQLHISCPDCSGGQSTAVLYLKPCSTCKGKGWLRL